MTDGTIREGDFRFVWNSPAEDSGSVFERRNGEWSKAASIEKDADNVRVELEDKGKGTAMAWWSRDGAASQARMWRCIDNAVKAMDKANAGCSDVPPANAGPSSAKDGDAWVDTTDPSNPVVKVRQDGKWVCLRGALAKPPVVGHALTEERIREIVREEMGPVKTKGLVTELVVDVGEGPRVHVCAEDVGGEIPSVEALGTRVKLVGKHYPTVVEGTLKEVVVDGVVNRHDPVAKAA